MVVIFMDQYMPGIESPVLGTGMVPVCGAKGVVDFIIFVLSANVGFVSTYRNVRVDALSCSSLYFL